MVAPLEQAAPHATLEQDQRDAATVTENSGRDHGAADIADADPGEAICAPGSAPSVTSRISVQKVCSLVGKFNKFKRDLVEEIGFGGMLGIKMLAKLNLKFSAWLMERVEVESSTLKIDKHRVLQIQDHDVQKVFSLPCGTRSICPDTTEPSEACKEFIRASAYLSKGAHSLKAAEAYLLRDDINGDSSKVQIDCFKIAFVIFVVGHLLAPSTKHDYITIDFWAALNDISQIKEFNWCAYVLEHLNRAVGKLKSDIRNRNITVHLVGCHLFLQVFYLDNLDLGPLSKTKDHLPRISLFDYESIKKMIEVITTNMEGDTSFAGANFRSAQDVCYSRVHYESHTHRADVASDLPHHAPAFVGTKHQHKPITPMLRSSFTETGQEDFSNHLRSKYPSLADHPLMTMLEEHNAHVMENISEIRRSCEVAMSTFADKLLGYISENRCCCRAAGRTDCLLRSPHTIHAESSPEQNSLSHKRDAPGSTGADPVVLPGELGGRSNTGGDCGEHFLSYNHPVMCAQTDLCRQIAHLHPARSAGNLGSSRVVLEVSQLRITVRAKILLEPAWTSAISTHATFLEIVRTFDSSLAGCIALERVGRSNPGGDRGGGWPPGGNALAGHRSIHRHCWHQGRSQPPCWRSVVRARDALRFCRSRT